MACDPAGIVWHYEKKRLKSTKERRFVQLYCRSSQVIVNNSIEWLLIGTEISQRENWFKFVVMPKLVS